MNGRPKELSLSSQTRPEKLVGLFVVSQNESFVFNKC